jgi:hypothetical protein
MRFAISRALIPASTNTRVPFATSRTALPVEPLPRTEIFMNQLRKEAKHHLTFVIGHLSFGHLKANAR